MKEIKDNFSYFVNQHSEIYKAYQDYGKKLHELGGPLDEKTRALLKLVISATSGHHFALHTHIDKGINVGLTREEIEHAILLTAPTVGFPSMMESLLVLRKYYEE